MQTLPIILAWFLNVLVMSLGLALFEILLEKRNGWGSGLNPNGWGRKLLRGNIVARIGEKPYYTVYHVFVFFVVLPAVFLVEYLLVKSFGAGRMVYSIVFCTSSTSFVMQIGNVRFVALLYIIAAWFAILSVEDFLWFLMNWYYPGSFRDLLDGKIWWHRRWINLGPIKLPRFYLSSVVLAIVFLAASICLAR